MHRVAPDLARPNGLVVAPEGTGLIVAKTFTGALRRYSLAPERRYGQDEAGPDGMAFRADGNRYVAHYGAGLVRVIRPEGTPAGGPPAGRLTAINVAFWDARR